MAAEARRQAEEQAAADLMGTYVCPGCACQSGGRSSHMVMHWEELRDGIADAVAQAVKEITEQLRQEHMLRVEREKEIARLKGRSCLTCGIAGGHKSGCYELMLNAKAAEIARLRAALTAIMDKSQREICKDDFWTYGR